jgi:catecholate siderophore receptor
MRSTYSSGVRAFAKSARVGAGIAGAASAFMAAPAIADAGDAADAATELTGVLVQGQRNVADDPKLGKVLDAPQSITIVPQQVIEERGATTLRDVLRNVPGISMQAGEGGVPAGDQLSIRGFSARTDIFIDGVRDTGAYTRDPFNLQSVEVLKGPASAYVGRGSTGGAINQVTKKPQDASFIAGTIGGGAPRYWRGTLDVNQAFDLGGLGRSALRVTAVAQDADSPGRDEVFARRWGIAPTLAIGLDKPTRATFGWMHMEQDALPDYGIPWVPATNTALAKYVDRPAPVDFDTYYGLVNRDYEETQTDVGSFRLEHDFRSTFTLSNTLRYVRTHRDSVITAPRFVSNTSTDVLAEYKARDQVDDILIDQLALNGVFNTGPFKHKAVVGFEVSRETGENNHRTAPNGAITDLYNPDPTRPYTGVVTFNGVYGATGDSASAYAFDLITLTPHWELAGGLRWENYDTKYRPATGAVLKRTDDNVSWKAGLIFKPTASASIYFGYGTSFNPAIDAINLASTTAPLLIDPESSRSYELGAKWEALGGRLLLTAAAFRTEKTNARTPGLPGEPATVLEGEQRVDGVEVTATGNITENWFVLAGYTYLDSEIVDSNTPAEIGKKLPNAPDHSFSLWSTYRIDKLTGGLGAQYVGERFANAINTRRAPGYWSFDAMASYDVTRQVTVRVNVYNLADNRFIDNIGGGHLVPGPSRSVVMTLDFRF